MLKSIITTFTLTWLFLAVSTYAQTQFPAVLDAGGQPVQSGVRYYILPAATDIAGGLTLISQNGSCPQFVGQEPLAQVVSRGLPITLIKRVAGGSNIVRENTDYSFVFTANNTCDDDDTAWQLGGTVAGTNTTSIVAGEEPEQGSPDWDYLDRYFKIVKNDLGLYTFQWCPGCLAQNCPLPLCGSLGISVRNGSRFLVLYGSAFPFVFRRA